MPAGANGPNVHMDLSKNETAQSNTTALAAKKDDKKPVVTSKKAEKPKVAVKKVGRRP